MNDKPVILIVDDVLNDVRQLKDMTEKMGYTARTATTANETFEQISGEFPELILLDVSMPDIDGWQICEVLKANPVTRQIPVIFVFAENQQADRVRAFEAEAVDIICKPLDFIEVKVRISTHLRMYKMQQQLAENNRRLNRIISEQSLKFEEEQKRLLRAIARLAEGSEYVGMSRHIENISANSRLLAQALNFTAMYENKISSTYVESIEIASSVHDIGKITIPQDILKKPGALTNKERELINTHTVRGEELLKAAYPDVDNNYFMSMAAEVIRSHHENWDGSGYPDALSGEQIPLSARIVRITDSYDCILGVRCYKEAHNKSDAIEELKKGRGTLYDPYLLDVFIKIERQMKKE